MNLEREKEALAIMLRTGCCAQCGGKRPTVTSTMRKYAGPQIEADPFCSSTCCREWHGCPYTYVPTSSASPYERPIPECGTTAAYAKGCRCKQCRHAENMAQRERRARKGDAYREAERRRAAARRQRAREAA